MVEAVLTSEDVAGLISAKVDRVEIRDENEARQSLRLHLASGQVLVISGDNLDAHDESTHP